jgi:hypothetical protein
MLANLPSACACREARPLLILSGVGTFDAISFRICLDITKYFHVYLPPKPGGPPRPAKPGGPPKPGGPANPGGPPAGGKAAMNKMLA